jgi:hypothetical protein
MVDGKEAAAVSGRWWFKGQTVEVPGPDGRTVRFKLANIYNTKNRTSGEPEAINLQLLPPRRSRHDRRRQARSRPRGAREGKRAGPVRLVTGRT